MGVLACAAAAAHAHTCVCCHGLGHRRGAHRIPVIRHVGELAERAETGPQDAVFAVTSDEHGIYTHVHGTLTLSHDEQKLDELWSRVAASWFDDGRRDPDIRLLCFTLRRSVPCRPTMPACRPSIRFQNISTRFSWL